MACGWWLLLLSAVIRRAGGRWLARQVKVQSDRPHGEAVASVEAPGAVVGGIRRYRGPLRAFLGGPREECRRELLADAAVAVGWIHVDAFQVGHPDGMHAAGAADASDQMARYLVVVTREQDQVVAIREERRVVRDAVLGGPAQIGGSGVMRSGICCEECIDRGDDLRKIIGRSCADPDRHLATLSRHEVAGRFSSPFSRSGRPACHGPRRHLDSYRSSPSGTPRRTCPRIRGDRKTGAGHRRGPFTDLSPARTCTCRYEP